MINIRKLAALDMALHGARLILAEFALGIVFPLILALLSLRSGQARLGWQPALGIWLVGIAVNYIPLFIYAVLIARAGTAREEGQPEIAHVWRYSVQQLVLLVPFVVAVIALVQEYRQRRKVES